MQNFKDTFKEKKRLWLIELRYYMRKNDLNMFWLRWAGLSFVILFGGALIGALIFHQSPLPPRYTGFLFILFSLPPTVPAVAQILTKIGPRGKRGGYQTGLIPVIGGWVGIIYASFFFFSGLYFLITGKGMQ